MTATIKLVSNEVTDALAEVRRILEEYMPGRIVQWHMTGSLAIVGEGADIDIVVNADNGFVGCLLNDGYLFCGGEAYAEAPFVALRHGLINIIVVRDAGDYQIWAEALSIAKRLTDYGAVLNKQARAALFNGVRDIVARSKWYA